MRNNSPHFENLTFIVTDQCKTGCRYCVQKRGTAVLDRTRILRSIRILREYLKKDAVISFYGGEPLLEFDLIRWIADRIRKDERVPGNPSFSLTTCGVGLTESTMDFLAGHSFALTLSLNGSRMQEDTGYRRQRLAAISRFRNYPEISLSLNMVLEPDHSDRWVPVLKSLADTGVQNITVVPDIRDHWDSESFQRLERSYGELAEYLIRLRDTGGNHPFSQFVSTVPGLLRCPGGTKRVSVSPDGEVWGCYLARDFFFRYPDHPRIQDFRMSRDGKLVTRNAKNYQDLKQCHFTVGEKFCINCPLVDDCAICPFTASLISGEIGIIPRHLCRLEKITIKHRRRILQVPG